MKIIKYFVVFAFICILIIPILLFNFEEKSVSVIDNRNLSLNPFSIKGDFTSNFENYVNDRIGLREDMILAYTVLNDKAFNEMLHPTYSYGKDGYVFFKDSPYHVSEPKFYIVFADFIEKIKVYCDDRSIPFVFVFNPSKASVFSDYLADGINYDNSWTDKFFDELDKRNIRYVNNTDLLIDKKNNNEIVFNKKYDAGHWNDWGAFYGTNEVLKELSKDIPLIHINNIDEFDISEDTKYTLPVSKFPIVEGVPSFKLKYSAVSFSNLYSSDLTLNKNYNKFDYFCNDIRLSDNAPRVLSFQGSYMNNNGKKFFENSFGEYIYIHNYQNVIDFPLYFNLFKPDCVVFETAEYTLLNKYFNINNMKRVNFNGLLDDIDNNKLILKKIDFDDLEVKVGEKITRIRYSSDFLGHMYLILDNEYDFIYKNKYYETLVPSNKFISNKNNMRFITVKD